MKDNKVYYVMHTFHSDSVVSPRKTAIVELEKAGSNFRVRENTFRFLEIRK